MFQRRSPLLLLSWGRKEVEGVAELNTLLKYRILRKLTSPLQTIASEDDR